jgi:hypothetical protein
VAGPTEVLIAISMVKMRMTEDAEFRDHYARARAR